MTKKDFIVLVIKVLTLVLLVQNVSGAIAIIPGFFYSSEGIVLAVVLTLATLALIAGLLWLVRKAHVIVNGLNLANGFEDDRIDFAQLKATQLIQVALFIYGIFLLVNAVPVTAMQLIHSFRLSNLGVNTTNAFDYDWASAAFKVVVGIVMVTRHKDIARWFQKRQEESHGEGQGEE